MLSQRRTDNFRQRYFRSAPLSCGLSSTSHGELGELPDSDYLRRETPTFLYDVIFHMRHKSGCKFNSVESHAPASTPVFSAFVSCLGLSSHSSPEDDCHVVSCAAGFRRLHRFHTASSSGRSRVHRRRSATAPNSHFHMSHRFPSTPSLGMGQNREHQRLLVPTPGNRLVYSLPSKYFLADVKLKLN